MTDNTDNSALEQANAQLRSIRDMVASLDVDYDRLEELREEKAALNEAIEDAQTAYDVAVSCENSQDDLQELGCELLDAKNDLGIWSANLSVELADLEGQAGDCKNTDDAEQRIHEDALSVEVRSDWTSPGAEMEAAEFRILLCTGGPHVEMRGELSDGEPTSAWLEYQDWFTGMSERVNDDGDQDALIAYASRFFYGE